LKRLKPFLEDDFELIHLSLPLTDDFLSPDFQNKSSKCTIFVVFIKIMGGLVWVIAWELSR